VGADATDADIEIARRDLERALAMLRDQALAMLTHQTV
jgi:hypothetical protein